MTSVNKQLSKIARCNLTDADMMEMSQKHGLQISTLWQVVKMRRRCSEEVLDTIIDRTKKRLDLNRIKVEEL